MRFSAPVPAATEPPTPVASLEPLSLPPMRGQVFEATTDDAGQLTVPLPLPPGVRLRVTVVSA
jgi:hypothetical protein